MIDQDLIQANRSKVIWSSAPRHDDGLTGLRHGQMVFDQATHTLPPHFARTSAGPDDHPHQVVRQEN